MNPKKDNMSEKKQWIAEALGPESKGKLRQKLHIKKGERIPTAKLKKAENSKSSALRKEATLAETLKSFKKGKK